MENKNDYVTFSPYGHSTNPGFIFYQDGRMEKITSFVRHSENLIEFHTDNDMYMYKPDLNEVTYTEDVTKLELKWMVDDSRPAFYKRVGHIVHDTYVEDTMVADPSISHIQLFAGKVYG